jgi:predicted SAM-dependent methyltransferase
LKLNLGCGGKKLEGFINVDCEEFENPDVVHDLGADVWPWPDSSADEAVCSHVLEHLPGDTFKFFLQQLYRVMKPDGLVHLTLPWPTHDIFRNDPTHCRPVTPGTMVLMSPRYIDMMKQRNLLLTDFGRRWGINFELDQTIHYRFDPNIKTEDHTPEQLAILGARCNNVIFEWSGVMKAIK